MVSLDDDGGLTVYYFIDASWSSMHTGIDLPCCYQRTVTVYVSWYRICHSLPRDKNQEDV